MKTTFALAFLGCLLAVSSAQSFRKFSRFENTNVGQYSSSNDGQYRPDNSGQYRNSDGQYHPDNSGQYVHQDNKYEHQDDKYKHQSNNYQDKFDKYGNGNGNGQYSGQHGGNQGGNQGGQFSGNHGGHFANNGGNKHGQGNDFHGSAAGKYDNRNYAIIRDTKKVEVDGYHYLYETENGILAEEQGKLANVGTDDEGMRAHGFFTYTGSDAVEYTVKYTADENGFLPEAEHLPTAAPVPELIARALEYQRAQGTL